MITIRELSKTYHTGTGLHTALDNINLTIAKGEIFGIIGHSGAGKSTLLHCINLLEKPSHGDIIIDNQNILQFNARQLRTMRRKIGMIFQSFNLLSSATAFDNIALPLRLAHTPPHEIESIVTPLLALTGLADKRNCYPRQLSGGEKQRVAIARALTNKPHVLLCDEPTSALDPKTTADILQLLITISQQLNLTIVIITHQPNVIANCCDRVALIHQGKILEENKTIDFFLTPQTTMAKQFMQTYFAAELPPAITARLDPSLKQGNQLIRISFTHAMAEKPLISNLLSQFPITVNILDAHIKPIRQQTVGMMILEVMGEANIINKSIQFLQQPGLTVEHLGYVKPNDHSIT